jgi:predicted 3-demethylubiquinone-9 3-methyltransferase (glyoxalase superfamily)
MQKIIPCLWFDGRVEDAAHLYTSLFPRGRVASVTRFPEAGTEIHGQAAGAIQTMELDLDGYRLSLLNGGPHFQLTPAISLFVMRETADEVDALWKALSEGGSVMMPLDAYPWSEKYGWLNDRFGVSWQIALGKRSDIGGQAMTPALLFVGAQHGKAEAALERYTAVFPGSKVEGILRHDGSGPDPMGTVMHAQCYLGGETFMMMDSALPHAFGFNEAFSFVIQCETQDEIEHYASALSAVPEAEQCGWVKDPFGVSWQVVPRVLFEMLLDSDRRKVEAVTKAFLAMKRFDIEALKRAYTG